MNPSFDAGYVFTVMPDLIPAIPLTLLITFASMLLGLLLAVPLAAARLGKRKGPSIAAGVFISFIRGTPPLVQLFLVFYGLPQVLKLVGLDINDWDKMVFAVITFILFCAAFLSEVIRSSYLAVDRGQEEAALSVGMSRMQALIRIVVPQAFTIALPNLGNTLIGLLKETSLVYTIGVIDLMGLAKLTSALSYGVRQLETFIAAALLYWAVCIVIEKGISFLEKMYKKGRREMATPSAAAGRKG